MGTVILERDGELATLAGAARAAADGSGSVVLISGEAGIGKSSLVDGVRAVLPAEGRLLVGWCDDLATPRVLGPLRDLAGSVGATLAGALERGDRSAVINALRSELDWPGHPTVLAMEDVHWADEATLDVLRYLVRRAAQLPLVLVLTYRDDELAADHPLWHLLGVASRAARVHRLPLAPLSVTAVRRLCGATGLDAAEIVAITAGNPYFVAEVVAAGEPAGVPLTIADAVRARVAQLDGSTRAALEQLAVVPSAVPGWLFTALVPAGPAAVTLAEQRGLLTVAPGRVTFRHELARRAVVDSMPVARRVTANRRVLAQLLARSGSEVSRIVHHAAQAGDREAILRFGPVAARDAATAGAHREAAAHLRLVLDQHPELPARDEANLWEAYAIESYTIGSPADRTVAAQRRAVQLRSGDGPAVRGASLRWLSRICWWAGDPQAANEAADEAVSLLRAAGDDGLLALALSNKAQLLALAGRVEGAELARQAITLAGDDPVTRSHALNNLGMALELTGDPEALATLEEGLRVALAAGEPEPACRAYVNLALAAIAALRLDTARRLLAEGTELAERSESLVYHRYFQVVLAMLHLATGAWDEVERAAGLGLDDSPPARCVALTVIARSRLRRGAPGGAQMVREAWRLAAPLGECQRLGPAAAALGEWAVLTGDPGAAAAELAEAYQLAQRHGTVPVRAELAYWLGRAGQPVGGGGLPHPYALLADGAWRPAADAWHAAGCRYEYALALTHSPEPDDLLVALTTLDALGAVPLARSVRAQLRAHGVGRVPRGPAAATRDNPAGLTGRQVDVVRLLAQGLTNAQIADRLVLSVRTVDSHVAAALTKLEAPTRRQVAARAAELGLLDS